VEDAEFWGTVVVRWAGKCFPRWADLDQASSGDPEPPEEVAKGGRLREGPRDEERKSYSRAPGDSLRSHSLFLEI